MNKLLIAVVACAAVFYVANAADGPGYPTPPAPPAVPAVPATNCTCPEGASVFGAGFCEGYVKGCKESQSGAGELQKYNATSLPKPPSGYPGQNGTTI